MPSLQPERRKVNGREMLTTAFDEAQATVQRQINERLNLQMIAERRSPAWAYRLRSACRCAGGLGAKRSLLCSVS